MDRGTTAQPHLDFARIYTDIDYEDEITDSVEVEIGEGQVAVIIVVVPWQPERSSTCQVFGHKCHDKPLEIPKDI